MAEILGRRGGQERARRLSPADRQRVAALGGEARSRSLEIARRIADNFNYLGATEDLRTILKRGNVGEAPPPEMLQPLNLRFSLNLKKP